MALIAKFTVYGEHIEDLKERAMEQGELFFRVPAEEITLVDLDARPVVQTQEGRVTRWKAYAVLRKLEDDEDE